MSNDCRSSAFVRQCPPPKNNIFLTLEELTNEVGHWCVEGVYHSERQYGNEEMLPLHRVDKQIRRLDARR